MDTRPAGDPPDPERTADGPAAETGTPADGGLLVPELRIQNFRGFRDLTIPNLGRVNLIVGKNSTGKSTVLEATHLLFDRANAQRLLRILRRRDEWRMSIPPRYADIASEIERIGFAIERLFYGMPDFGSEWPIITIRSPRKTMEVSFCFDSGDPTDFLYKSMRTGRSWPKDKNAKPVIDILIDNETKTRITFAPTRTIEKFPRGARTAGVNTSLILGSGATDESAYSMWSRIALSEIEDLVVEAIRLVQPNATRLVGLQSAEREVFIVRISGTNQSPTLKSLGDGARRLCNIALAAGNTADGLLLIDEIENGLHWSVQPKMWEMIFALAESLNVQVFATTHSYDCVRSFTAAALKHPSEGRVVRLERPSNGGDIVARVLDEEHLEYAMTEEIEVR